LKTTMDNTSSITNNLDKIVSDVQSGEGIVGRLLMDQTLQQNIDTLVIHLKDGSDGFKILMDKSKNSWLMWGS